VPDTADELDLVLLELHASPAADAETATCEVLGKIDARDVNICGQALEDRH